MTEDRIDPRSADEDEPLDETLGGLFAAAGEPASLDPEDRSRSLETLEAFQQARRTRARRGWMMGGVALATASAAAFLLWSGVPRPTVATEVDGAYTVAGGSLMLDGVVLDEGDTIPIDRWLVSRERACVRVPGGTGCAKASSRLRVHETTLELQSGTLDLVGNASVVIGSATVHTSDGAFVVSVDGDERFVTARRGEVHVEGPGGSTVVPVGARYDLSGELARAATPEVPDAEPGAVLEVAVDPVPVVGDATERAPQRRDKPAKRETNPGDFLVEARGHVASGRIGPALAAYRTLQRRHPRSVEAQAASVSIGKLELQRGRARASLRAFGKYLKKGGALASEARWGTIRAYHRLGDVRRRDQAIEALRTADPKSVYLRRAEAL